MTLPSETNQARLDFEQSEKFAERSKPKQRIEEKNGEMKIAHGLRKADSSGRFAMQLQMFFTTFKVCEIART